MAFTQATAPHGLRTPEVLSADNAIPERHIVIETLRNAAPRLNLTASVISTLDAMLSCLAPKRNHHTVFASNATLTFRRNGISDRTLRRHAATLQEIGLLTRHDSPNKKRFTKHNTHQGKALRFGFDLTPLFDRLHEIAALAAEVISEQEQINYLRTKIRAAANAMLLIDANDQQASNVLRTLRRKLSLQDCQYILETLTITNMNAEAKTDEPNIMSASDGHNVRHHHNSNIELIDEEPSYGKEQHCQTQPHTPITVHELISACPEAVGFSLTKIETHNDVITHARTLAPMIGISLENYEAAHKRLGPLRAATTVWAIMQFHHSIKAVGAYFRAITTGSRSSHFSPEKLIRRLLATQRRHAHTTIVRGQFM